MDDSLQIDAPFLTPRQWHEQRQELFAQIDDYTGTEELFPYPCLTTYNSLMEKALPLVSPERARQLGIRSFTAKQLVSVVVPVFNEDATIDFVLRRLASCPIVGQILVVNDASSDGTAKVLEKIGSEQDDDFWTSRLPGGIHLFSHAVNQGKGAALRSGFVRATLDWVGVQDADTEYDPLDLIRLMDAAIECQATVAYGSRYLCRSHSSPLWHRLGNGAITWAANRFTGLALTDVETCYKVMHGDLLHRILDGLKEDRFGIEIELTAKLARQPDARFIERPISYQKRTYAEGKKIGVRDGLRALWCMFRYRVGD